MPTADPKTAKVAASPAIASLDIEKVLRQALGPTEEREKQRHAHAILKAIIPAAKADGHVNDAERAYLDRLAGALNLEPSLARQIKAKVHTLAA